MSTTISEAGGFWTVRAPDGSLAQLPVLAAAIAVAGTTTAGAVFAWIRHSDNLDADSLERRVAHHMMISRGSASRALSQLRQRKLIRDVLAAGKRTVTTEKA